MEVSINGGTPKSSIFMGFSIINHPFLGTPMTMETSISSYQYLILAKMGEAKSKTANHPFWRF